MKTTIQQGFGEVPGLTHYDSYTGYCRAQEQFMHLFNKRHQLFDQPSHVDVDAEYMALTEKMEALETEMDMLRFGYEQHQWYEIAFRKSVADKGGA